MNNLTKEDILRWLREDNAASLNRLWSLSDQIRKESVGDAVYLRGILEISNHCSRKCRYCGINADMKSIGRYTMTQAEILEGCRELVRLGYGTVVLQSGEDFRMSAGWVAGLIEQIKLETNLAVTLSLGERTKEDYILWKNAGADRYLLKIETANPALYAKIHPPRPKSYWSNRSEILQFLKSIGYEAGSGVMIGIPGQTYEILAADLIALRDLDLDMLGIGPYIPHPGTELYHAFSSQNERTDQVENDELMTHKANALARIMNPLANIPTTTALASINRETGRELSLSRGANVIMPNFTPLRYRRMYDIYPNRVCLDEFGPGIQTAIKNRILSVGRKIGQGPGVSQNYFKRMRIAPNIIEEKQYHDG